MGDLEPTDTAVMVARVKVSFAASLANANAGMKYIDHDRMDEIVEAAWIGFEGPLREILLHQQADSDKRNAELEACLAGALGVIDRAGMIWMGDIRARAALNNLRHHPPNRSSRYERL